MAALRTDWLPFDAFKLRCLSAVPLGCADFETVKRAAKVGQDKIVVDAALLPIEVFNAVNERAKNLLARGARMPAHVAGVSIAHALDERQDREPATRVVQMR